MTINTTYAAQSIQKVVSPKHGIEAWLIASPLVPMISMNFSFIGGSAYDSDDQLGLTNFAVTLLDEGAGDLDADAFHRQLEEHAIILNFSADLDRISCGLQVTNEHRDEAFKLLKMVLTQPRFDNVPFERVKKQALVSIERKAENPDELASDMLSKILFPNHAYGRPVSGTKETVTKITQDMCKNFAKERFVRKNLIVSVAGDITADELGKKLDQLFGELPDTSTLKMVENVTPNLNAETKIIKLDDRPQTYALFAHRGIPRSDPDFYAAYVLNYIVGGGSFQARLMEEVRTKRGLTYGIGTQLNWNEKTAYTMGSTSTKNESFSESLKVIQDVYKAVAANGPTTEELKAAKDYLIGSFPLMMDSTGSIAGLLNRLQRDGLPIDFLPKRNEYIRNVTDEQIKKVAQRLFGENKLTCVAAGNPV